MLKWHFFKSSLMKELNYIIAIFAFKCSSLKPFAKPVKGLLGDHVDELNDFRRSRYFPFWIVGELADNLV